MCSIMAIYLTEFNKLYTSILHIIVTYIVAIAVSFSPSVRWSISTSNREENRSKLFDPIYFSSECEDNELCVRGRWKL